MKIIPAVDIMNGNVVRLFQGNPKTVNFYNYLGDPVTIAKKWEEEGADALHIVDLDAAFERGSNMSTIINIVNAVNLPVQVGGGIRSIEKAEAILKLGVDYVVLGTLAFSKLGVLNELARKFRGRIIVALDHLDGKVMAEGWKTPTGFELKEALSKFLKLEVETFLLTSIKRDGTLKGVELERIGEACACKNAKIIASGGVGRLEDLTALKKIGVYGVVIGKALYERVFTLEEALRVAHGEA